MNKREIKRIGDNGFVALGSEVHRVHQHYDFVAVEDDGLATYELNTEIDA